MNKSIPQCALPGRNSRPGTRWGQPVGARFCSTVPAPIRRAREQLGRFDSLEMGKPISKAIAEADIASAFFRYYAETLDKRYGHTAPTGSDALEIQVRIPQGVVASIAPWNYPIINAALKAAPALAAGNAVVLKPSEYSSGSALLLAELCMTAGLPRGVLNVITGARQAGACLVAHGDVNMVAFTGSTATASAILRAIGNSPLRPLQLECGGKCPQIVFADALDDNDAISLGRHVVAAAMENQGQLCVARSRLLVEECIAAELLGAVRQACAEIRPLPPNDTASTFGPLANQAQFEKVSRLLADADKRGANIVVDGRDVPLPDGLFIGPTVVSGLPASADLTRCEAFGPILTVETFAGDADALAMANATDFGLAATAWTSCFARAHRVAAGLRAGTVHVNATTAPVSNSGLAHAAEPTGQSGFGVEGGMPGLDAYSRLKSMVFNFGSS